MPLQRLRKWDLGNNAAWVRKNLATLSHMMTKVIARETMMSSVNMNYEVNNDQQDEFELDEYDSPDLFTDKG